MSDGVVFAHRDPFVLKTIFDAGVFVSVSGWVVGTCVSVVGAMVLMGRM